jgi:hypothetical protein
VDENEQAMGFQIATIVMPNILEGAHRWILEQFMDFNCFTWVFNLDMSKQWHFVESHSPAHPPIPFLRRLPHLARIAMSNKVGVML